MIKKNSSNKFAYFTVLPSIIVLASVFILPVFFNLISSFTNMDLNISLAKSNFVGISNYLNIFKDIKFWTVAIRNVLWTLIVLSLSFIIGLIFAVFLQNQNQKFGKIFLNIWVVPWAMPEITTSFIFVILLSPNFGPLNQLLLNLKIISETVAWLSSTKLAIWGCIIAAVWRFFPFNMAMIYSALQTFPEELEDAAKVDGVNKIQLFWYLKLKWISSTISIISLLGFVWVFNWFSLIYGMTKGGPSGSTEILAIHIYRRAIEYFHTSEAATLSIITITILFPLIIIFAKYNTSSKE